MFRIASRLRRPVSLRDASTTASRQFRFAGKRSVESGALRVEIKSMSRVRFAHERTRISRHPVVFLYCHPGHRSRHPGLRPGISSSEQNQILSRAQNDGLRRSRSGRRRTSLRSSDQERGRGASEPRTKLLALERSSALCQGRVHAPGRRTPDVFSLFPLSRFLELIHLWRRIGKKTIQED